MKSTGIKGQTWSNPRLRLLMMAVVCMTFQSLMAQPHRNIQFTINDFVVTVDKVSGKHNRAGLNRDNISAYLTNNPGANLSGSGKVAFREITIPVTFNGINVRVSQNNTLIATSGEVKGLRAVASYNLDGYVLSLKPKTLLIKPTSATVSLDVKVPMHSCSEDTHASIDMRSDECAIFSDGSIHGDKFAATGQFQLKKSAYTVVISNSAEHVIKLGDNLRNIRPSNGVYIKGKDISSLFSVHCNINENPSVSQVNLKLINPVVRILEYDTRPGQHYYLKLNEGTIDFKYDADTLQACSGIFPSRVKIPERFDKLAELEPGEIIDTFDLVLKTDISNALFDSLDLINKRTNNHYIFKSGPVSFQPSQYKAWLYFPNWIPENSSSYATTKSCDEIQDLFMRVNVSRNILYDRNPGLTITRGIIYLRSPQINFNHLGSITTEEASTVKTYFSGYLTFTPYGLHGSISSGGNTFVPYTYSMDSCEIRRNYFPTSWDQIITKGDALPGEMNELFTIEKLRIQQMKLVKMDLCKDLMQAEATSFRYYVHFPYPSFLTMEFEDKSFDLNGKFNKAYGPLAIMAKEDLSYRTSVVPSEVVHTGIKETIQVPVGYFFWAWRLPVTFADKGIEIDYSRIRSEPNKSITIKMSDEDRNPIGELYANEISFYPLYSDNSAFRRGVRFKAFLNVDGMLYLDSWDRNPFFGKYYSKKFKCNLTNIGLADLETRPTRRLFDFNWDGQLQFPFFSGESVSSWNQVNFQIKDLVPFMPTAINLPRTSWPSYLCDDGQYKGSKANPDEYMTLSINNLIYDTNLGGFTCNNVVREETHESGRLELFSYNHALFILPQPVRLNKWLKVTRNNDCRNVMVSERIIDAISSNNIYDLVCYDTLAAGSRNVSLNDSLCCGNEFYYGTYQIVSYKAENDSTITLSASNAKYYPFEIYNSLSLENSTMIYKSGDNQTDNVIDIPGMQLVHTEEGYYGAFGSTYTDVALSLPYEGEFRFFLDPKCGYFYNLGAGSFTYGGITFRGQVFIFHAPRRVLEDNPFNFNTTPLLEDMAQRSLSDIDQFRTDTQLKVGDDMNSILTGFLTTGGAEFDYNWGAYSLSMEAGNTNYLYHVDDDQNTVKLGMFTVFNVYARVNLKIFSVNVFGNARLALIAGNDLQQSGEIKIKGCANVVLIGNCCATAFARATMSNQMGLDIEKVDFSTCCNCN